MSAARPLQHNPLVDRRELERLHSQAYSWALSCTGGRAAEGEDVLQMTYLAILEGRARYDGNSSLRTWLFAVIRNIARSGWRLARYRLQRLARLATFVAADEEAHLDTGHAMAGTNEQSQRIIAAWRALPTRQREIVELVFYRELSIAEAAAVLGISIGTARLHYERAKTSLRRRFAEQGIEL